MLAIVRRSLALLLLGIIVRSAGAQDLVSQCVNGAPSIPTSSPHAADASQLLARLAWRDAYADYAKIAADADPVAAFDSIVARGEALLVVVGVPANLDPARQALEFRLATLRTAASGLSRADLANGRTPSYSALSVSPVTGAKQVDFVKDATGNRTRLDFDVPDPSPAIALCAIARTVTSFFEQVAKPEYQRVANEYSTAVRHWNTYINEGYSMTFVERLGNSCRLGPADWIVAPTVAGRCGSKPWKHLGPPMFRTVFVHPSGGWIPVFDKNTGGRTAAVVEWYGIVATPFVGDRLLPIGVSFTSVFPDAGTRGNGIVLHVPFGHVAWVKNGITAEKRGRLVVTGDIAGWIPSNRIATARDLVGLFSTRAKGVLGAAIR
jgi:hypothetical protein